MVPGLPFSSDADIIVRGEKQNSENLGLPDVYTVENVRSFD